MNNEIKEIIEDNGELMVRYKDDSFECFDTLPKNVLDYITNLKEENERLKEDITAMNDYIGKIQKENNILKENAEHNDKVVDKAKWNEMIYKSRNEKAIEYLTDDGVCILNKGMKENEQLVWTWENYYDLLDILQGSDKE